MKKLQMDELNRLSVEEFKKADKSGLVIVLDNIRSQHNIGSVFRTADAFRAEALYLCGITATPPHREIQKTALGATESVHWAYFEHTPLAIEKLKAEGYCIIAVEQTDASILLNNFVPEKGKKYALVFGNEVHGVAQDVVNTCDLSLEIPQFGTKHSLNIAVSAGIVLWHFYQRFQK
jgi:23S rRNA (guanosine2251-2'-O)-methyltransferase